MIQRYLVKSSPCQTLYILEAPDRARLEILAEALNLRPEERRPPPPPPGAYWGGLVIRVTVDDDRVHLTNDRDDPMPFDAEDLERIVAAYRAALEPDPAPDFEDLDADDEDPDVRDPLEDLVGPDPAPESD